MVLASGVHLELPPFLEDQREAIEWQLVPFNTEPLQAVEKS